jgi:AraC-like DNA-binding protein
VTASIPAIHALHLLPMLARWGVDEATFAGEFQLNREALSQPGARVSVQLAERVLARAHELTGESELGFFFGLQMRVSAHGFLGFAAMTSPTVRSALQLAEQFAPTLTDALSVRLIEAGPVAQLRIEELAPLGGARHTIVTALLVGIWQMASSLTATRLEGDTDMRSAEPADYRERFAHLTPRPVRFGAAHDQLSIAREALDTPLLMADPSAQRMALEQCQRELGALTTQRPAKDAVRAIMAEEAGLTVSLAEVAKRLHVSERTLKRRLMEQGTSFAALVEEARRARAIALLQTSELSLADVAERVGYTELANFVRAFRRWTGVTPHRFRRALK